MASRPNGPGWGGSWALPRGRPGIEKPAVQWSSTGYIGRLPGPVARAVLPRWLRGQLTGWLCVRTADRGGSGSLKQA